MSFKSIISYRNNSGYREQYQINEEFPYKQNESVVASGASLQMSKRDLSGKTDFLTSENVQNRTILQALNEAEKEKYSENDQQKAETSLLAMSHKKNRQNNGQSNKSRLLQSQEQNTVFNIEEGDYKIIPIRLMKVLKLLVNIQHFFRILSMNTRIFNKLTFHQHDVIGDVASIYSKNSKLKNGNKISILVCNIWYYILIIVQRLNIQVFAPSNMLIKVWDSLQSLLIFFSTFLLNLELFFEMDIQKFQLLFQVLFNFSIIDILVELNTGVLQKGDIIYDRNFIFQSYMKNTFFLEIIGNIPLFFFIQKVEINNTLRLVFNLLFTFKWVKISKVLKQVAFYVSYEKDHKNIFDLFKLLVFVIGICHIFCLFWHGLCLFEINNGYSNNWIATKNLLESTIYERYIYSFYFLAVTMATVGYGDITPQNSVEVLFTTITIFVTCVVYAFSLNTIGSIIESIEKKDKKYKENMQIIHGLMREEEVSRELKIEVSNYIEYLYKESNEIQKKQEKLIVQKLSTKLRNDLILEVQGKYLNNIPLFKHIKEKDKIAKIMEEQLYSPGETIFNQGDYDDSSLYYIVKGSVSIIFNPYSNASREAKQIQLIKKKEYFGEISFINGNPRTFSAKAADFCRIYKINREQFLSVIQEHDQDFENFQMIKEAISLNRNYKFCSIFCSTCKSGNHYSIDCPRTHLTLTRQILISRYNSYQPQERGEFQRRKKKCNYYQKIELLRTAVVDINNRESFFEILDSIENGVNILNSEEDEANQYDNQKEIAKRKFQNQNTMNSNNLQVENHNNPIDSFKKIHTIDDQQNSKNNLNQLKQQQNKPKSSIEKVVQSQQQQPKKSFLFQASQQLLPENQSQEQYIENQPSAFNNSEQLPSSSSSSEDDNVSMCSYFSKKPRYSKDNLAIMKCDIYLDEDSNQYVEKPINETQATKKSSFLYQKRDSGNFGIIKMKGNNQQNMGLNELTHQQIINDLKNVNADKQKGTNNLPKNIIQSRRTVRGTQDRNYIENILKLIQIKSSLQQEEQPQTQQKYSVLSNEFSRQISKLNRKSLKNITLINPSQALINSIGQNTSSLLGQNIEENIVKIEKKLNEVQECPDQASFQMLQIFDKAKIFKYYLPNFNYPEIIQKWVAYQYRLQKRFNNSLKISQKKKRYLNKRKQSSSQLYIKQTEI